MQCCTFVAAGAKLEAEAEDNHLLVSFDARVFGLSMPLDGYSFRLHGYKYKESVCVCVC